MRNLLLGVFIWCFSAMAMGADLFVTPQWVKDHSKELKIVDARGNGYVLGHIKKAINVKWQQLSNMEAKFSSDQWGTVLSKDKLKKELDQLGLSIDDKIVIYGKVPGWGEEGRILWTLKKAGFKNLYILDGGIEAWSNSNGEKEYFASTFKKVENKDLVMDESTTITTKELIKEYKDLVIIDTRSPEEYNGAIKYKEARGGHLVGAINVPYTELFNEDGKLKKEDEIKDLFSSKGIKLEKGKKYVTYCTAGIRSGYMQVVLENMGFSVRNYDSSFYAWAGREDLQLAK